jgi:hypothetical protein
MLHPVLEAVFHAFEEAGIRWCLLRTPSPCHAKCPQACGNHGGSGGMSTHALYPLEKGDDLSLNIQLQCHLNRWRNC